MNLLMHLARFAVTGLLLAGCASQWKIQGGPKECLQMCQSWDMDLTGMVGVGNQDATSGEGATACVCQVRKTAPAAASNDIGAPGTAAGMAAAIVAIQEAQRRQQQQQQQQQQAAQ
jgi:hypothetical protein